MRASGIILLFLFSLSSPCLYAQSPGSGLNLSFDQLVPPSPGASSLGKFSNVPVGLSTGVPQISVPIYRWSSENFGKEINISLDYHAGGIQVDEMASNVGLGWALNAGGVISRTVRGIYDEFPTNGFIYKAPPINEYEGNGPDGYQPSDRIFNRMHAGLVDTQNDLFSFNFNGRIGRFVLGRNNDILLIDQSKLRIEKVITTVSGGAKISKFVITDEDGYSYEFSDYELTTTSMASVPPPHTSSWYLSKISTPAKKDHILFEYSDTYYHAMQTSRYQAYAIPVLLDGVAQESNFGGSGSVTIQGKRIKRISFPDSTHVTFTYQTALRQDIPGSSTDHALAKITVSNGSRSFGYELVQDYSLNGRLTLLRAGQFGQTATDKLPPYQFFYADAPLPDRFSSRRDHWGYANGNPSQSMIPKEYIAVAGGANNSPYREFNGGTRETDPNNVLAGSLTQVSYPTGGYTVYEMEANTANDAWLDKRVVQQVPRTHNERGINFSITSEAYPSGSRDFTFEGINNATTHFEIRVNPYTQNCSSCGVKFELYNSSGGLMTSQNFSFPSPNANTQVKTFGINNLVNGQTYTFKAYVTGLSNYYDYAEVMIKEPVPPGTYDEITYGKKELYVGGLRAKRISDFDGYSSAPSYVREFEYLAEDNQASSGSLGYRPVYSYIIRYDYTMNGVLDYIEEQAKQYVVRTSSSVNELPMVNGSPVTYGRVVEKIGRNGTYLGKTVRTFTSFKDSRPYISQSFPTIPPDYAAWNYGLLLSEVVFNAEGDTVKKTANTYTRFPDSYSGDQTRVENFRSIAIAPVTFNWEGNPMAPEIRPQNTPIYFRMTSFTPRAGASALEKTTVTDYVDNVPAVANTTEYTYDRQYFYVKEAKTANSKKVTESIRYMRPNDMVAANENTDIYLPMRNINMVNPVIRESHYYGTSLSVAKTTQYKNWSGSLFAPELVSVKYKDNPEEEWLRYLQYDTRGAPLSVQENNGPLTSYIWGYNGQYPVAEVRNAAQSDMAYAGFEDDGKGNWSYSGSTVADGTAPTGRRVYSLGGGSLVKSGLTSSRTYVLTYWAKSGSAAGISGGTAAVMRAKGGWTQYRRVVSGVSSVTLGGSVAIDDVRLHPIGASMETYTYDPLVGMTSRTDASGNVFYYEYDGFGRLKAMKDLEGRVVEDYQYHYRNQ